MKKRSLINGAVIVGLSLVLAAGAAHANPCFQPDNGTGTVTLPPAGCEYLSPDQVHMIIDGLPPGTTIILKPIHKDFLCRELGQCGTPGGSLGGETEVFTSTAVFEMSGTGQLAGFTHTIQVPLAVQTDTAPRQRGARVQDFAADMQSLQGSASDSLFQSFAVVGGTANGFPSPGHTTLTRQPNGTYLVESKFSVGYEIRFVGAPGSKLEGFGGATRGTVNMTAVNQP
jgi:hypothetical protein